jgi:multidrug efflux pump subunit AcrA (membrane-fusion protein)
MNCVHIDFSDWKGLEKWHRLPTSVSAFIGWKPKLRWTSLGAFLLLSIVAPIGIAQDTADAIAVRNSILKPTQTVSVAAGVAGVIESVLVAEGDQVAVRQTMVQIRCDEAKLNHERAILALETASAKATRDVDIRLAEKSAQVAEQELGRTLKANQLAPDTYPANEVDRYRLMFERSKIEIERYKLDQQLALFAKKQAELELKQTQQSIDRHAIGSTVQAIVVSIEKHAGEWVDPSDKMLELMSIDRLRVEGFVDANDALELRKGQVASVTITVAKVPQNIQGKVVFVSPIANPANGQIRVFIEIQNRGSKFRPGMTVAASISR